MKILITVLFTFGGIILFAQEAYIDGYGKMMVYDQVNHVKVDSILGMNTAAPAFSKDNSTVYVVKITPYPQPKKMIYIDPSSHLVYDSMDVDVLTLTTVSDTTLVFGSNEVTNSLYIIDPENKTFDSIINDKPFRLTQRPNTKEVWFVARNHFGVIDYSGTAVTVTNHPFAGAYGFYRDEIKFTPNGDIALMTNAFDDVTYKIDAINKTIVDSSNFNGSIGLTFDGTGNYYFQSKFSNSKIYKHQISDMAMVDSFSTNLKATILYLAPNKTELYAIYHDESKLEVFNVVNYSSIALTSLSGNPYYIAFENSNGTANISESKILKEDFILYPNPSNGIFNLKSEKKVDLIEVYSNVGKKLFSTSSINEKIDLTNYPNGLFYIKVSVADSSITTIRVIKD